MGDPAAILAGLALIMSTAQTCFLAWLAARYGDTRQRITELQGQAHELEKVAQQFHP